MSSQASSKAKNYKLSSKRFEGEQLTPEARESIERAKTKHRSGKVLK